MFKSVGRKIITIYSIEIKRSQAAATPKRIITNRSNAFGDSNRSQTIATTKRTITNGSNTIRDSNRSQAAAIPKRTITNGSNAISCGVALDT